MSEPVLSENLRSAASYLRYWMGQYNAQGEYVNTVVFNAEALTVSGGATPTALSAAVDVRGAQTITLQGRNTNSTVLTITAYSSLDGTNYDDTAYASMVLAASQEKTIPITAGVGYLKIYIANGDAVNATAVSVDVATQK